MNIAILLFVNGRTPDEDTLYLRFDDPESLKGDAVDLEVLEQLADDFANKISEMGALPFLQHLEDSLSNTVLLTERYPIDNVPTNPVDKLEELFGAYIVQKNSKRDPLSELGSGG